MAFAVTDVPAATIHVPTFPFAALIAWPRSVVDATLIPTAAPWTSHQTREEELRPRPLPVHAFSFWLLFRIDNLTTSLVDPALAFRFWLAPEKLPNLFPDAALHERFVSIGYNDPVVLIVPFQAARVDAFAL